MALPPDLPEDKRTLYSVSGILAAASASSAFIEPSSPDARLKFLSPLALTESAQLFRCVLKRLDFSWEKIDDVWMSSGKTSEISFSNELRFLRTIRPHVNVVQFLEVVDEMGVLIEHVDGVELTAHLGYPSPIAYETKVHWINQMVLLVSYTFLPAMPWGLIPWEYSSDPGQCVVP